MSRISMSAEEIDTFLQQERILRLTTLDNGGWPTIAPVWYVWHDGRFWVWNLNRSKRTQRLEQGVRTSVAVDAGVDYLELRGLVTRVTQEFIPFTQSPLEVRTGFAQRYLGRDEPIQDKDDHTWLRLTPSKIKSWDFRKLNG